MRRLVRQERGAHDNQEQRHEGDALAHIEFLEAVKTKTGHHGDADEHRHAPGQPGDIILASCSTQTELATTTAAVFRYSIGSAYENHGDWRYDEIRLSEAGNVLHEIEIGGLAG